MPLLLLLLPVALFVLLRVALVDPRTPTEPAGNFGLAVAISVGSLPVAFAWAPDSPIYNVCLVFALSTVVTPVLFSAMKTDTPAEWLSDKVFLVGVRTAFALGLVVPLTYLRAYWFLVLAAIALASFATRFFVWVRNGGEPTRYVHAFGAAVAAFFLYFAMISESRVTASTWTNWREFIPRMPNTSIERQPPAGFAHRRLPLMSNVRHHEAVCGKIENSRSSHEDILRRLPVWRDSLPDCG
jgi:hypothetical protein